MVFDADGNITLSRLYFYKERKIVKELKEELSEQAQSLPFETASGKLGKKAYRYLCKAPKKGASLETLIGALRKKYDAPKELKQALQVLRAEGRIVLSQGKYYPSFCFGLQPAQVSRVKEKFGYAVLIDGGEEVFIPGKYLRGCLPKERVLLKKLPADRRFATDDRYSVEDVLLDQKEYFFTGTVMIEDGAFSVLPDHGMDFAVRLRVRGETEVKVGDKIQAKVVRRGERHSDLRAQAVQNYGCAQVASVCARAVLDDLEVVRDFSEDARRRAKHLLKKGITEKELAGRADFRNDIVFTIDAATSKDLDDAVSLRCCEEGYELGVHIADVSHYVKYEDEIDREAFVRGTSVYYADQVIPMLPKELSNGICSLNPGEDRLTLSAILTLDRNGRLLDFDFKKGIIRSRVKGVYDEINAIYDGKASAELLEKYAGVMDSLDKMRKLAAILTENKRRRGAPEIDKAESKIVIGADGKTEDVVARERGISEIMIEEFMLLANEAAAKAARLKGLPFVYRIHEPPTPQKLEYLHDAAEQLGLNAKMVRPGMEPGELSALLDAVKDSPAHDVLHTIALRSMSKARYSESPVGHYGLALTDYAHFTSPIRRYPDLTVHRMLSSFLHGKTGEQVSRKYAQFVKNAARCSSDAEVKAMTAERRCSDCYKAEYMSDRLGQTFEGIVSSVVSYGIYVELPNTIEGFIHHSRLLGTEFEMVNAFMLKDFATGKSYRIGDRVCVRCIAADVSLGRIDFEIAQEE